jgi:hypothetical protein
MNKAKDSVIIYDLITSKTYATKVVHNDGERIYCLSFSNDEKDIVFIYQDQARKDDYFLMSMKLNIDNKNDVSFDKPKELANIVRCNRPHINYADLSKKVVINCRFDSKSIEVNFEKGKAIVDEMNSPFAYDEKTNIKFTFEQISDPEKRILIVLTDNSNNKVLSRIKVDNDHLKREIGNAIISADSKDLIIGMDHGMVLVFNINDLIKK